MKRIFLTMFAGLALLTACSSKAGDHNAQDVTFAQEMIPHHEQAVEMATIALAQGSSTKVKDLATRIKAAQDPEIQTMKGWLSSWDKPVQAGSGGMDHGNMGSMGSMSGQGMATDAQMGDFRAAQGADLDQMFLKMMTAHHQGAVAMARTQLGKGSYGPAKALAQSIIDGQQKEIDEMQGLLNGGL